MTLIETKQLSYAYQKDNWVIKKLSLSIQPGITGLLGVNGAGKSTLIALLTGQLKAQAGTLDIFGKDYQYQRRQILNKIALVPQEYAFYPTLSVKENLLFFAKLRKELGAFKTRVDEALDFCRLKNHQDKVSQTLSGGFKRRLNLAIGIVNKPSLLFLDEPTIGIDPVSRNFILTAIQRLKKTGVSIVYTSHQMAEIDILCDQVIIINQGEVLHQGDLSTLKKNNGYTFEAETMYPWPQGISDFVKQYELKLEECHIVGQLPAQINIIEITQEFHRYFERQQANLKQFSIRPSSMESLFLQKINHA
ncbi:MAG: ABC transporter ATP-binding protein [Gammaproteobacteria bacterium]|nr:MAG: ABC transporter ATP-binding protein [Gammaproteobacteria bacterium]